MRYRCTIYSHAFTATGSGSFAGTDPAFDAPAAEATVRAGTMREAAARAYVRCVGRDRARLLRGSESNPGAGQEANPRAVAACLRKTPSRIGEVYQMDNVVQAWFIKVEPASPKPSRLRLPPSLLLRLSRTPSPN